MFGKLFASVVFATALVTSPALADQSQTERDATKVALERGKQMYAYDQAAWHATDSFQADLRKNGIQSDKLRDLGLRGYVVEPADGGLLLATFFGERDGNSFAYARYWVEGSTVVRGGILGPGDEQSLSSLALRLIALRAKAIDAAITAKVNLCSKSRPNTIVLPPGSDGIASAYIMTSTNEAGTYPLGGHYRYDFDAAEKLVSSRAFMKTCMSVDYGSRDGKVADSFVVSHILDPQPTEVHVFVSYNIPIPLFVSTTSNKILWRVGKGQIIFMQN
jgi:hypothetical protein